MKTEEEQHLLQGYTPRFTFLCFVPKGTTSGPFSSSQALSLRRYAHRGPAIRALLSALPLLRMRFTNCRDAAVSLRKSTKDKKMNRKTTSDRGRNGCESDPCPFRPRRGKWLSWSEIDTGLRPALRL